MGQILEDGTGEEYKAKVTSNNKLAVISENLPARAVHSIIDGTAFQVSATATEVAGAAPVLYLQNDDPKLTLTIAYIRLEIVGTTTTLPDSGSYFSIHKNSVYGSGGVDNPPVNMNFSSANMANTVSKNGSSPITITTTGVEFDRWWPEGNGKMLTYNKEDSVVLKLNDSIQINWNSTAANGGTAYARISFSMKNEEEVI